MNIYEKLLKVQEKLKAPKSQYNSFGDYNYRNVEDVMEAVKPLCVEVGALINLTDDLVMVGERYYVKSTARFIDITETAGAIKFIDSTAYAREEQAKKGMDGSQITGASSSYARKYALNGLLAIDDTKDSDTTNTGDKVPKKDNPYKDIKEEDLPWETSPEEKKNYSLEKAFEIEVNTKNGMKKLKDLTDEQLRIISEQSTVKEWVDGAKLILLFRAGQK